MSSGVAGRPKRGEARRSYDRLVAAATEAFAKRGADVPVEAIAGSASVDAATMARFFPSREALLEAAYGAQVELICARARELAGKAAPEAALALWLHDFVAHLAVTRGLTYAIAMAKGRTNPILVGSYAAIRDAVAGLLASAQLAGAVRSDVSVTDLLRLAQSVAVTSESADESADRLLALLVEGLRERD